MMQGLNVFDYGTYRYFLYCCTKTLHEEFQHAALGPATHEQPGKRLLATFYCVRTAQYALSLRRDYKSEQKRTTAESTPRGVCCFVCPIPVCLPHKSDVTSATLFAMHWDTIGPLLSFSFLHGLDCGAGNTITSWTHSGRWLTFPNYSVIC